VALLALPAVSNAAEGGEVQRSASAVSHLDFGVMDLARDPRSTGFLAKSTTAIPYF
jgi:hypothetical protein